MSVLLVPSRLRLVDPEPMADAHGWASPSDTPVVIWEGSGNFQEDRTPAPDQSLISGGAGPYDPVNVRTARAYMPLDVGVVPGLLLFSSDEQDPWLVTTVKVSRDPRWQAAEVSPFAGEDTDSLGCLVVSLTQIGRKTGGDLP